jgi:hypothetical protein
MGKRESGMANERTLGDKLAPRLSDIVCKTILATKLGLTDHEVKVRQVSGQNLIDKMGREAAELGGPFIDLALSLKGDKVHPMARAYLESVASGDDQVKAIGGILMGGAQGALSQVIGNVVSPAAYLINRHSPNLDLDPQSAAQAQAARIITLNDMYAYGADQGYNQDVMNTWRDMAQQVPSVQDINSMIWRGFLSEQQAVEWLERLAIPDPLIELYEGIRPNLLSVSDAALAVLRGDLTTDQGKVIARQNGYTDDDFNTFLLNTGEPPGAEELMEALRRGFIDEATFKVGIRQSRVRDQWVDTLLALRYSPLSTSDAVNAYVEGYISEDDVKDYANQNGLEPDQYKILIEAAGDPLSFTDMMNLWRWGRATEDDVRSALKRGRLKDDYIDFALNLKTRPISVADAVEAQIQGYLSDDDAKVIAEQNGITADDYEVLRLTAGDPASRTEMIELWRRGFVTEDQVKAALRESRLKDSYIDDVVQLKLQLPALYETRTLLADGGLTAAQGTQILLAQGYDADIVKAIVANATGSATAATKTLTEAMYADLYKERAITADEFQSELKALGYTQAQGELIQTVYDNAIAITTRNGVITKVKAAYIAHKITEADAQTDLNSLGIPADMVTQLIEDWDIIISTDIRQLTAAQVTDAWQMSLFSQGNEVDNTQAALTYLSNLGYSNADAVILLEIKNKGSLTSATATKQTSATGNTTQTGGASQ